MGFILELHAFLLQSGSICYQEQRYKHCPYKQYVTYIKNTQRFRDKDKQIIVLMKSAEVVKTF